MCKEHLFALVVTLALVFLPPPTFAGEKRLAVIASIKPLQLLVMAIGGDRIDARTLLAPNQSPHHATLRLSEMRALENANLVFWLGPQFEQFLARPLAANPAAVSLQVDHSPALSATPDHSGHNHHGGTHGGEHYWLDPLLALELGGQIHRALLKADAKNKHFYDNNSAQFELAIRTLDAQLQKQLAPVRTEGFVVLHDAYGHFVARYRLNQLAAVSPTGEYHKGVKHMKSLRKIFASGEARCFVMEPNYDDRVFRNAVGEAQVNVVEIDPLAGSIVENTEAYILFMERLAAKLISCLS